MIEPQAHGAPGGVGVPRDVGQRLGHDPVAGHFDRRGQVGQVLGGSVQAHGERGGLVLEPSDFLAQRSDQAELIEGGWPETVDDTADIGHRPLRLRLELAQQFLQLGLARDRARAVSRPRVKAGQRGAEPVVQVAAQPPPLLFPRGDQARPGHVQRPPQRHRMGRRARLPGQVGQQPLVVGAKLLAARPRAHQEPPDGPLAGRSGRTRPPESGPRRTRRPGSTRRRAAARAPRTAAAGCPRWS